MNLQMPITKRRITHHFQYAVWMYMLLIALALFGWNLIYTTTRYRPPESMQVEFYAEATSYSEDALTELADRIHEEVMPEMEAVTSTVVSISDDYYGEMQITVWISASQGDVYLLSSEYFESFAASGAFLDLTPYIESGELDTEGLDLTDGYIALTDYDYDSETNTDVEIVSSTPTLYGIPAAQLAGFTDYSVDAEDKVLCILYNNGNDEYSVKFLNYLLENLR